MTAGEKIFTAAWEYPPILSGESVVCRRTLEYSKYHYDVCCAPVKAQGDEHVRIFPVKGNKYLIWPFRVLRQFIRLNQKEHYRIMMSRVMPPNGHLAGWLIKMFHPKIRWIVYFSDPVWNSPFLKFSLRKSPDHRPNWLLMKLFGIPAKWAVRRGDLLVFNNERLARFVLGKQYDRYAEKVLIVPYGHEGVRPNPAAKRNDGKFRLTHVGQIYGNRTFADLIAAAEQLLNSNPELFEKLEIRQVGFVCEAEQNRIKASPAGSIFTLAGQVAYEPSIEEMYNSDCLLVIDPVFDDPRKNIYVPGKIYDYMSTGRPILCIADEDSATGDIASAANGAIYLAPPQKVYEYLKICLAGLSPVGESRYEQFHCRYGVDKLDQKIESIMT